MQIAPSYSNPIIPGYYADPCIIQDEGKIYIYATIDPWGSNCLACWESEDWKNWHFKNLNWPTKKPKISLKDKNNLSFKIYKNKFLN